MKQINLKSTISSKASLSYSHPKHLIYTFSYLFSSFVFNFFRC